MFMNRARRRKPDKGGLDLIEEATHVLREASAATLAAYYAGAIPFIIGFLYFCADMSRSPFASQYLAEAALATAALFIWMKFWQAVFARRIRAQFAGETMPRWSFRQLARVFMAQAVIQPSGLFMVPLALVLTAPFGWVYAFYQNVTALADADSSDTSGLVKKALKQASLWPGQNHVGIGIALAFGCCIFLNCAIVFFAAPGLIRMLFGVESIFSKSPIAMLNTTFIATIFGLTYLCVDPILKTVYALRCFYGESLNSGEDLKADLKQFAFSPQHLATVLVISILLSCGLAARAAQSTPAAVQASSAEVSPEELDHRIDDVIHERKYTWRMPRENAGDEDSEKGIITRFLQSMVNLARDGIRTAWRWVQELVERWFGPGQPGSMGAVPGSLISSLLLYGLLAFALSALGVVLVRIWRGKRPAAIIVAEEIPGAPDIADESIGAEQLPEDGWTKLARELLERGEFRLAMRAFYLASLAHLAGRNLIGIARFKSNRDYENELRRRGHAIPSLLSVFATNVSMFERIWYGVHEVNRELVQEFAANVDRIKGGT
ncbi:MAG TPA: hypothetical protein VE422_16780 [Terriglobia bacterium]|nr:hypothetical protein [Terriglobia bacterium]